MIKNWLIKCNLASPLCGDPPMIDALLEYELACRLGYKMAKKLTRMVPLSEIEHPPIPIAKRTLNEIDFYCTSDPILGNVFSDYTERQSKHFDTDICALLLDDKNKKNLLTSSGPYKSRFVPIRVRVVDSVQWFVRGDRKEIHKLLKKIVSIGKNRAYGYGRIASWEYIETEENFSIFAKDGESLVLMKTLPIDIINDNKAVGFRHSFGGAFPPYWHPDTFREIGIPC